MELFIIRHGESEADLLGVHEGRADFPLTEGEASEEDGSIHRTTLSTNYHPF